MIVGFLGEARAGKDTCSDFLVRQKNAAKIPFADEIKRTAKKWYKFSEEQLWGSLKEEPDPRYKRPCSYCGGKGLIGSGFVCPVCKNACWVYLTPRHALQILGTEVGRLIYPNTWVDITLDIARTIDGQHDSCHELWDYHFLDGLVPWNQTQLHDYYPTSVAISDVRFLNEVKAIKEAGGKVVKVVRPGSGLKGVASTHKSETEQASIPPELIDAVLTNDSSLESLEKSVVTLYESFKQT